jgi:hypothetical protein
VWGFVKQEVQKQPQQQPQVLRLRSSQNARTTSLRMTRFAWISGSNNNRKTTTTTNAKATPKATAKQLYIVAKKL